MKQNPVILIVYDYFFPGYKAGGPVQSLTNLIISLQHEYDFAVLTTVFDLMSDEPYQTVKQNAWNEILLPGVSKPIKIWYAGKGKPCYKNLNKIIKEIIPRVMYLNGVYSFRLFLLPLLLSKFYHSLQIVVCPRGMLQKGALSVKNRKKKYYIRALQLSGLLKKVIWHATTNDEAKDISKLFSVNKGINVAYNIPKSPVVEISFPEKKKGVLNLIYLSLITEKKNLFLLLQVFQSLQDSIRLSIYGPVKDTQYWQQCKSLIEQMQLTVKYMGDVQPHLVQETLAQHHAMILLSKGENFGHALYESFSVGRPVLTSFFTPWNNLREAKAGANLDVNDTKDCQEKIIEFAKMPQDEYDLYCLGAHSMAFKYYESTKNVERYKELFK